MMCHEGEEPSVMSRAPWGNDIEGVRAAGLGGSNIQAETRRVRVGSGKSRYGDYSRHGKTHVKDLGLKRPHSF